MHPKSYGKCTPPSRQEHMYAHIAAWKQSGQTQKEFCLKIGEHYAVFHYWLSKYRREQSEGASGFAKILPPESSPQLEIVYPNGVKLLLPAGADPRLVGTYLDY